MRRTGTPQPKIDKKYIGVFIFAVLFSWIFHELAHLAAGKFLDYDMKMTLNSAYPGEGKYLCDFHYHIISAAGPLFTLCEAILVFILMYWRKRVLLYPFLFTCFYMRLLAMIISFLNPNDEARISTAMGIGKFTLPIIVSGILFYMVYKITSRYTFTKKFNLVNLALAVLFTSAIILADKFFHITIV